MYEPEGLSRLVTEDLTIKKKSVMASQQRDATTTHIEWHEECPSGALALPSTLIVHQC